MKSSGSDYKEKVFDPSALQFCLGVVDFAEAFPSDPEFLRRATLDALSFSQSLQEVAAYLAALSDSSQALGSSERMHLLRVAHQVGHTESQETLSFLMTVQKLSQLKSFDSWTLFFNSVLSIGETPGVLHDFLITVRCLAETNSFDSWADFFNATKVVCENSIASTEDFFLTMRNLATNNSFSMWKTFFAMSKIVAVKSSLDFPKSLFALRHCLAYFRSENSFFGILRMLTEAPQHSEAFALGQLDSKQWLIDEATKCWGKSWGKVFVLAGWVGVLPRMLFEAQVETSMIRSFDIDEEACRASEFLNQTEVQQDWRYKSSVLDITKMQYPTFYKVRRKDGSEWEGQDLPDVVINTSCEHIADISSWWQQIPSGTKVILQSNDGFHIPEHVACFKTLNDFDKAMGLSRIDYRGEKALPEFNRFMLIGIK